MSDPRRARVLPSKGVRGMTGQQEAGATGPQSSTWSRPAGLATAAWSARFDLAGDRRLQAGEPVAELTLLDAFRQCGGLVGDPAVDAARSLANGVLYGHLRRLARHVGGPREVLEEAVQTIWVRLANKGPRGVRATDPGSDEAVTRYLVRSLKNGLIDHFRREGRRGELDVEQIVAPEPGASDGELEAAREMLREATATIFDTIAPAAATHLRKGADATFRKAIEARRRLALSELTCQEAVVAEFGHLDHQTRNRFDQQQCRALKRLRDAIAAHVREETLEADRAAALREVFEGLKAMELDWRSNEDA